MPESCKIRHCLEEKNLRHEPRYLYSMPKIMSKRSFEQTITDCEDQWRQIYVLRSSEAPLMSPSTSSAAFMR